MTVRPAPRPTSGALLHATVFIDITFYLTAMSSDPTPLTLESLQPYSTRQEELIETLLAKDSRGSHGFYFRTPEKHAWQRFWNSAWGKDLGVEEELVVGDLRLISQSLIFPDVVPSYCDVLPKPGTLDDCWGGFARRKFLIRDEYKEAEESVLSTFAEEGMISASNIMGQPGIGLPLFLLNHSGSLGSFFREISLPPFHSLAASRAQASHCATGRFQNPHPFS